MQHATRIHSFYLMSDIQYSEKIMDLKIYYGTSNDLLTNIECLCHNLVICDYPHQYLHCQCASLKLYFWYDIVTNCIKNIFRYIIFWHLACYLWASSRVEFTQKYTTYRPFLSTTFVIFHFSIHRKQIVSVNTSLTYF